jgi:hypothetical protein
MEQLYEYMTQHMKVLKHRPHNQELGLVYSNAIRDHDVRMIVLSSYPKTLKQVNACALNATSLRHASHVPRRRRQPCNSSHSIHQHNQDPRPRGENAFEQQQHHQQTPSTTNPQHNTPLSHFMLPTSHACHLCNPCLLNSLRTIPTSLESMTLSPDRSCSRQVCQEKNLCFILASLEGLWPTNRAPEPANGEHCQ